MLLKVLAIASYNVSPLMVICGFRCEKTLHLLRLSTNRPIFWCPPKTGNASRSGYETSTETNSSWTARCQESMAGGVTFPNQAFQGTFSPHHKAPFNVSRFQLVRHPMSLSLDDTHRHKTLGNGWYMNIEFRHNRSSKIICCSYLNEIINTVKTSSRMVL